MFSLSLIGLATLVSCSASTDQQTSAHSPDTSHEEHVDCAVLRCVALTFDDGPDQFTEELLNTLKSAQIPATFFLIGSKVEKYPGTVQRMSAEGHQVGSHTWDHSDITKLSGDQLDQQLTRTDTVIKKLTGDSPSVFRPPLGHHDVAHNKLVPYPLILWDVHSHDGRLKESNKIVDAVMDAVQPGSVILMHDTRQVTVHAVPELLAQLKLKGYTLVTVDQLFDGNLKISTPYSSAPREPKQ